MKAIKSYILWVFQNVPLHVKQGQLSYICCILVHVERSLFTEAATGGTLKRCSYKFRKIQRKTPVPESLFNKVAGGACNFVETCASLLTTEYLNRIQVSIFLMYYYHYHHYCIIFVNMSSTYKKRYMTLVSFVSCPVLSCLFFHLFSY